MNAYVSFVFCSKKKTEQGKLKLDYSQENTHANERIQG